MRRVVVTGNAGGDTRPLLLRLVEKSRATKNVFQIRSKSELNTFVKTYCCLGPSHNNRVVPEAG